MPIEDNNTCLTCSGSGKNGDGFCTDCMGTGATPVNGINSFFKEQFSAIRSEQASQREDLTNALSAIWNKVKDL